MRYQFADCVLDTDRRELYRSGRVVGTRPKVFEVLTYLIEHHERVVPKEELLEKCWAGRIVGDATLNSCLKEIRKAIGDSGTKQKFLRTVHGHGYHFVAPVAEAVDTLAAAEKNPSPEPSPGASPIEREYKQVSVLACVLHGADDMAARIGPEEMDAVMRSFFATARVVLERYGGTVTEWLGDGFTALFGAPAAFEDHARRAVFATLELRDTLQDDLMRGSENDVSIGAGLHAGQVLVGVLDQSDQLFTAIGATMKIAHRIGDIAETRVLASGELYRLIEADFEARSVDGQDDLPELFEIGNLTALHSGVPRRQMRRRSRFVGRDDEMSIIKRRMRFAMDGVGQAVCITGEPGIGKSRLLIELREEFANMQVRHFQANCLAYRQSSPYFPLVQLLYQICGLTHTDSTDQVEANLRKRADDAGMTENAVGSLMPLLDASDHSQMQREQIPHMNTAEVFKQASRLLLHDCADQPLVIAIEDLHWMDESTEQWLMYLIQAITALPVLLLVTYRPGYQPLWLGHSQVTQLALPRLNDEDSNTLVGSLTSTLPNPSDVRRRIVNNAQGNPFFLEELASNQSDNAKDGEIPVPTTVQAVLASRIDQLLQTDKALLQAAAVIGTPVPFALLEAVSADLLTDIDASISRLENSEFLYEDLSSSARTLFFKHALTQDVAYQSLLSSNRRERHLQIAEAYERHLPEQTKLHPELVAHHFTEAQLAEKAMGYWREAGIRAAQRSANPEAVSHFENALSASEALQQSAALKSQQLDIYLMMGPPIMSTKAFTSPAVEAAYQKARRLCDEVGTKSQLLTVLWGLWLALEHRGRIADSRPLARQIVTIAEGLGDDGLMLQAHHAVWTTEIWHGDLKVCDQHARAGMRLYDRDKHAEHKYLYGGHDPGVCARGTAAISAWFLGRPDEALRLARSGAKLAESLEHPYSRIITMHDFMEVEALRGNPEISGRYGRLAIKACTEQRVPNYLAVGQIYSGYGKAASGEFVAGMAQMREGLTRYRELRAERNLASYLLLLAELCHTPEHCAEGISAIDEAEALLSRTGEIRWLPEIKRRKGELLLVESSANTTEANGLFHEALEIASEQGCRSFELRAATSLARLLQDAGEQQAAIAILRPVYQGFTEGFETGDLQKASLLLRELR